MMPELKPGFETRMLGRAQGKTNWEVISCYYDIIDPVERVRAELFKKLPGRLEDVEILVIIRPLMVDPSVVGFKL
jgi:hypothetical protein